MAPAPRTRYVKGQAVPDTSHDEETDEDDHDEADEQTGLLGKKETRVPNVRKSSANDTRETTVLMRRPSNTSSHDPNPTKPMAVRSNTADLRQHLKHLGPSNVASRPKATKYTSVKIKPGVSTIPENQPMERPSFADNESQRPGSIYSPQVPNMTSAPDGGVGAGLVDDAGNDAKDGVLALANGYGTMTMPTKPSADENQNDETIVASGRPSSPSRSMTAREASAFADKHTFPDKTDGKDATNTTEDNKEADQGNDKHNSQGDKADEGKQDENGSTADQSRDKPELPEKIVVEGGSSRPVTSENGRSNSVSSQSSTLGEMESRPERHHRKSRTRSGSITETVMDVNGMKKVVLEANSSSDEGKKVTQSDGSSDQRGQHDGEDHDDTSKGASKKKKKKKRAGKKFHKKEGKPDSGDSTPALGQHNE